ncbi:hypothetical protein DFR52_11023 [Hoeflea marina]|uniref:Uncharacterized protein n=1 Tax=Hoeflea marina TaxID=274592 RepID=A0A317PEP1_9HYPH|nr:hypothetical protein DFR52_11023 [Hoeflea marina]
MGADAQRQNGASKPAGNNELATVDVEVTGRKSRRASGCRNRTPSEQVELTAMRMSAQGQAHPIIDRGEYIRFVGHQNNSFAIGNTGERCIKIINAPHAVAAIGCARQQRQLITEPGKPKSMNTLLDAHGLVHIGRNSDELQGVHDEWSHTLVSLIGPVVPIIVIAEYGVNTKRRMQSAKRRRPFRRIHVSRDNLRARDVVSQEQNDIGIQFHRLAADGLDPRNRHPRITGMNVGDHSRAQFEVRRPAARG